MMPEDLDTLMRLFGELVGAPGHERAEHLDRLCAGDPDLRARLVGMLRAHESADALLDTPPSLHADVVRAADAEEWLVGRRVGGFSVTGVIASGGMGVVYRAEQDHPRREVALKIIRRIAMSEAALARFDRETELLGRLQHPGIARVYDAGVADVDGETVPFIAMELVAGRTIIEDAEHRRTSARERLDMLARVCDAVQHAHERGVIHRDLKPANILVDERGDPKVLDFGVARATEADVRSTLEPTVHGQIVGTLEYMSPEQAGGDPDRVDTRTDVYSLGVLLFQLIAERLPHDLRGRTLPDAVRIVREDTPLRLGTVDRSLRGDLDVIAAMALDPEAARRYASAAALADDIRRYLRHEPIVARTPSTTYQVRRFARRHRVLVTATAAIFALLIGGITATSIALYRMIQAEGLAADQRDRADQRFDDLRDLATRQIFDVHDALADLPGSTEARRVVVTSAAAYLDSLAAEAGEDLELAAELASSYERLGEVQRGLVHADLGDTAGAENSYEKALTIRRRIAEARPGDSDAATDLARCLGLVGDIHRIRGDSTTALRYYTECDAVIDAIDDEDDGRAERLRFHAASAIRLGVACMGLAGRLDDAGSSFTRAMALSERATALAPENARIRRTLAICHEKLGDIEEIRGNPAEALRRYRAALEIYDELARANPNSALYLRTLAIGYTKIADVSGHPAYSNLGRLDEARQAYEDGHEIMLRLVRMDEADVRARRIAAFFVRRIGEIHYHQGNHEHALASFSDSLAEVEALAAADPASSVLQADLHACLNDMAMVRIDRGELDAAFTDYRRALKIAEDLSSLDPSNANWTQTLAHACRRLGEAFQTASLGAQDPDQRAARARDAVLHLRRALNLFQALDADGGLVEADRPVLEDLPVRIEACVALADAGTGAGGS